MDQISILLKLITFLMVVDGSVSALRITVHFINKRHVGWDAFPKHRHIFLQLLCFVE